MTIDSVPELARRVRHLETLVKRGKPADGSDNASLLKRISALESSVARIGKAAPTKPQVYTPKPAVRVPKPTDNSLALKLAALEREVERLQVKERPDKTGWIPVSGTWTYASATTIAVPSGATNIYSVGMGIRLTANGVVKQAYIIKVEDTKLTVAGNALTNYTFSAISYAPNPATAIGFPVWFNYTPTLTVGGGTAPTFTDVFDNRFSMIGKLVNIQSNWRNASGGTAGSGTSDLTVSLPVNPAKNNYVTAGIGTIYSSTLGTGVIVQINPQNDVHFSKAAAIVHLSGNDFSSALRELTFTIAYEAA